MTTLKDEIIELGPWHMEVEVTPALTTRAYLDAPPETYSGPRSADAVAFLSPREPWQRLMRRVFGESLDGRSFLDCGCNCGGYCFWAKELGAGHCVGFDVREHWIKQARWLAENREASSEDVDFRQMDVYDLPADLGRFDIVMFQGLLYHLPDPVSCLKKAADMCDDVLLLDSAARTDLPDGMLAVARESETAVMSGVYGLNWFPTGPEVMRSMLDWLGFEEIKVVRWAEHPSRTGGESKSGRIRLLAAREKGRLSQIKEVTEPEHFEVRRGFEHVRPAEAPRGD